MTQADLIAAVEARLQCVVSELEKLRDAMSLQFGVARPNLLGHNPERLPHVAREGAQAEPFNIKALLSKRCTYSRWNNLGATQARVRFGQDNQVATVTITLAPGDVLETRFVYDNYQILEDGEGPVLLEVIAQ